MTQQIWFERDKAHMRFYTFFKKGGWKKSSRSIGLDVSNNSSFSLLVKYQIKSEHCCLQGLMCTFTLKASEWVSKNKKNHIISSR